MVADFHGNEKQGLEIAGNCQQLVSHWQLPALCPLRHAPREFWTRVRVRQQRKWNWKLPAWKFPEISGNFEPSKSISRGGNGSCGNGQWLYRIGCKQNKACPVKFNLDLLALGWAAPAHTLPHTRTRGTLKVKRTGACLSSDPSLGLLSAKRPNK